MATFNFDPLVAYIPKTLAETDVAAAVLVLIVECAHQAPEILLMIRPEHFSSYPGDVSFPGGIKEVSDQSLQETALREVQEEIGIVIQPPQVIAQLNDFYDRYRRLVRPFVAKIDKTIIDNNPLVLSEEVARLFYLPLPAIKNVQLDAQDIKPTHRKPSYIYHHDGAVIWGLTASILVHLNNILYAQNYSVGFIDTIVSSS